MLSCKNVFSELMSLSGLEHSLLQLFMFQMQVEGSKQFDNCCHSFLKLESNSGCLLVKLEQNPLAQASSGVASSLGKAKHSGLFLMPTLRKEERGVADNKTCCCVLQVFMGLSVGSRDGPALLISVEDGKTGRHQILAKKLCHSAHKNK